MAVKKGLIASFVLLSALFPAAAQVDLPTKERTQVRTVGSGPEFDLLKRVVDRLEGQTRFDFPRDVMEALIDRPEINAWADPQNRVIVVTTAMVRFLSNSEGELACIVGHEMGHLIDRGCRPTDRASSGLDELLGGVLGGGKGRAGGAAAAAGEKTCEARADEMGLQFAAGAGYNPYDCAASFGRMMMFQGDTSFAARWLYASTHPLNADRIVNMRSTLVRYCQRFPDSCK